MVVYGYGIDAESIRSEELSLGLSFATVAEIRYLIDRLNLPLKKSVRKQMLVDAVTALLTAHPEYLVGKMSGREITVTKQLLSGEKIIGDSAVLSEFYLLVKLGWVAMKDAGDCQYGCEMILREEAENLLRPLIAESNPSLHSRIMQFIDGWAAMCGLLPVDTIMSHIVHQPGFEKVTYADVMDTLTEYAEPQSLIQEGVFNSGHGDIIYISPWCKIVGSCGKLMTKEIYDHGKKVVVNAYNPESFSYQQIMDASIFLFAPHTPNVKERRQLERICRNSGMNAIQTDEVLLETWIEKQSDKDSMSIGDMIKRFPASNSIDGLNEIISGITGYMNTLPFWRFLGHSSKEMASKELAGATRAPRIVAGPNMRAMGMDVPEGLQDALDMMWETPEPVNTKNHTVGRNDPCPCGSGKKYKKCCGK